MKKIILSASLALFMAGSAFAETVRMGTEGAYPPYNFINDNYKDIKVTKLAKGLASGTDLEYSDFNTLSNAFENRTNIN